MVHTNDGARGKFATGFESIDFCLDFGFFRGTGTTAVGAGKVAGSTLGVVAGCSISPLAGDARSAIRWGGTVGIPGLGAPGHEDLQMLKRKVG